MKKNKNYWLIFLAAPAVMHVTELVWAASWKEWSRGSGIALSVTADRKEVEPNAEVTLWYEGTNDDRWTIWEQEDISDPPPPRKIDEGYAPDKLNYSFYSKEGSFGPPDGYNVVWTAPAKKGTYILTVTASDAGTAQYYDGEAEKTVSITVSGAKLSHLEVIDEKNTTRKSKHLLRMVKKSGLRSAVVKAYKENQDAAWAEKEPLWSGLEFQEGGDQVIVRTGKSGTETARAGDVSRTVTVEIIDYKERKTTVSTSSFGGLLEILNSIASAIGGDSGKIRANIRGSCKRYPVDQTASPDVNNTYEFSASGGLGYNQKVYIPALSVSFPCVKIGIFAEPAVALELTGINIVKDGSLNPADFTTTSGGVTLSGSVSGGAGVKIEDPWEVLSAEADLKGTAGAGGSFKVEMPGPVLNGSYEIGTLKVEGVVKIEYRNRIFIREEVTRFIGNKEGFMSGGKIIDLSGYFNWH